MWVICLEGEPRRRREEPLKAVLMETVTRPPPRSQKGLSPLKGGPPRNCKNELQNSLQRKAGQGMCPQPYSIVQVLLEASPPALLVFACFPWLSGRKVEISSLLGEVGGGVGGGGGPQCAEELPSWLC